MTNGTEVRRVLRDAQPSARTFAPAVITGTATALSTIALLAASAWLITRAAEQPALLYLSVAVVGVRAFALSRGVFRYLERLTGHNAALARLAVLRTRLVRRLVPLAPDGTRATSRGALLATLVDDVDELQNLPLRVVQPLLVAALASLASIVFVGFVSLAAAGILFLALVLAFAAAVGAGWLLGARAERQVAPLRGAVSDALVDHLASLDVLIAYDADASTAARIDRADAALRRAITRRAIAQGATAAAVALLAGVASLAILVAVGPGVGSALTGPGLAVVVLLPLAVFEIFGPVPLALASWRQVQAAASRIAEVVPEGPIAGLPHDEPAPTGKPVMLGDGIELRGLGARWPEERPGRTALHDVNLRIPTGTRTLITGSSGAGKTTLAHVLVRFLDYTGDYLIGGISARTVAGDDLRQTVGLVEQSPYLFDESIRQNLLFAHDTATDDELLAVLARVGLASWVAERGGLDARVGERGQLVSGGQAQRLGLARALLADFPALVLDEPTAGVEPALSDALLRDALDASAGRTVVLISHVDVPEELVDHRVDLSAGTIVETTTAGESGSERES